MGLKGVWNGFVTCMGYCTLLIFLSIFMGTQIYESTRLQRAVMTTDAILITGASSGIGEHAALAMNAIGFTVFATVRKQKDADNLMKQAINKEKFIPVIMDVTNQQQIDDAVAFVTEKVGQNGLTAVYNNAGVYFSPKKAMSVEYGSVDQAKWIMDVNYIAIWRVAQAFLPLMKKAKGRFIINTSIASFVSGPFGASYCASKFAARALGHSLRRELQILDNGMHVSMIEPGLVLSKMSCKVFLKEKEVIPWDPAVKRYPEEGVEEKIAGFANVILKTPKPKVTTDALIDAVLSNKPRIHYLVGLGSWFMNIFQYLPSQLEDLLGPFLRKSLAVDNPDAADLIEAKRICNNQEHAWFDAADYVATKEEL